MKRITIVLLLLLAVSVRAGDYLDTFAKVRSLANVTLGTKITTGFLSDTAYNELIRDAIVDVTPAARGIKGTDSFLTTYQQWIYALDTSAIAIRSVLFTKNDSVKSLLHVPIEMWYQKEHKSTKGKIGFAARPSYYDYDDDNIYLFPSPSNRFGDTIKVFVSRKVTGGLDTLSVLTGVDQAYRVPIARYVIYRAALSRSDSRTEFFKLEFERSMANARSLILKRGIGEVTK